MNLQSAEENIVIIGCGRLGSHIANELYDSGNNVTVVDQDEMAFRKLSASFGGLILEGNGMSFDVLERLGLNDKSSVIVVSDDDNTNLMISEVLCEIFHVQKIICRLQDESRAVAYQHQSIQIICPMDLATQRVKELLD